MIPRIAAIAALTLLSSTVNAQDARCPSFFGGHIASDPDVDVSVTVFMTHEGRLLTDTTVADAEGYFELDLPTTPYRMLVWAEGYAPARIAEPQCGLSVDLEPLINLRGRVEDPDGWAVEGARVRARHATDDGSYLPGWIADSLSAQQTRTDAEGQFVIYDVIPSLTVVMQADHVFVEPRTSPRRRRSDVQRVRPTEIGDGEIMLVLQPLTAEAEEADGR